MSFSIGRGYMLFLTSNEAVLFLEKSLGKSQKLDSVDLFVRFAALPAFFDALTVNKRACSST
jgi:hypothetical protein